MTTALAQAYTITHEYRRQLVGAFGLACIFLIALYVVNVYRVISHTVALESIDKQTTSLTASVDALDSQYLELSSKANPDTLADYGLQTGQVSLFISRTASLGSVALRAHEL